MAPSDAPPGKTRVAPAITIVVPVYNEAGNLPPLISALAAALSNTEFEVVFVNDGSSDESPSLLDRQAFANPRWSVIHLSRNFGQTAALAAGIYHARGDVLVTLDADGQNDPVDILRLVDALKNSADVACGWRRDRKDTWLTRKVPSRLANALISWVTGVSLHDHGCTLKAFRRSAIGELRLYGEMHRLIPVWCAWKGARLVEVEVRHHPRRLGRSHYGLGRTFKVLLDLITAKFFFSFLGSPSHALGGVGFILLGMGFLAGLFPILDKFWFAQWGHLRIPFMIFSVFLGLLGMQFLALGVLAEILVRIYYENKNERPYRIARISGSAAPGVEASGRGRITPEVPVG